MNLGTVINSSKAHSEPLSYRVPCTWYLLCKDHTGNTSAKPAYCGTAPLSSCPKHGGKCFRLIGTSGPRTIDPLTGLR